MKKLTSVVFFTTLINCSAIADDNDAIIDMLVNMAKQSDELGATSQCFGVTEEEFIKSYKKVVSVCVPEDGLSNNCLDSKLAKSVGITKSKATQCFGRAEQQESADEFDSLSDDEYLAQAEQSRKNGLAMLEAMTNYAKKSAQNTENLINLPIYSNSHLASHQTQGLTLSSGKTTLPMATFTSADSIEKVAEFYKKALPDFKVTRSDTVFYVLEEVPENLYELSLDMTNYPMYFVPHVEIYELPIHGQKTTHIVIVYEAS